jgi:hypothetical protein
MSSESFFTEVVETYHKLLSSFGAKPSVLSLREYYRSRHVARRDFQRRASTTKVAIGLPTDRKKNVSKNRLAW